MIRAREPTFRTLIPYERAAGAKSLFRHAPEALHPRIPNIFSPIYGPTFAPPHWPVFTPPLTDLQIGPTLGTVLVVLENVYVSESDITPTERTVIKSQWSKPSDSKIRDNPVLGR
jgi:hypothetical protein